MIPTELARLLAEKRAEGWSGTLTLNLKDGCVLSLSVTETIRIQRETDPSRATNNGGGSHAQLSHRP